MLTYEEIINSIETFQQQCHDIFLSASELNPIVGEELEFYNTINNKREQIIPDRSAVTQFLTKIKVPVNFFHRCPPELQQLILDQFNKDRDYLLRCYSNNGKTACRAVLSSMFTRSYDNHKVFPVILSTLQNQELNPRIFVDDKIITRMEVLSKDIVKYKDRTITSGLMVTNSETGHSSLWIEPIVLIDNLFLFACRTNAYSEYKHFRQIHKGEGISLEQVSETVRRALEAAQVGVIQYMENMDVEIKSEKAIDFVKNLDAFPKRFTEVLKLEWKEKERLKKEKVMRDILEAASELPLLSKISVEQSVGQWYGMFEKYSERMEQIIEQKQRLEI
jgi:hypothetical protein